MNQVVLSGKAGRDAKCGITPNGKQWANVSLATSEKIKEVWVSTWHNITCWGKEAEVLQHVKKGNKVIVVGKIQNREYEKDGVKKQVTDILAREVGILSGTPSQVATSDGQVGFGASEEDIGF
jgi:single-strand DNA-binding protein